MQFSTPPIHAIASMWRATIPPPCVDTYRFPPPISFGRHDPQRELSLIEFVSAEAAVSDKAATTYVKPDPLWRILRQPDACTDRRVH